MLRMFALPLIVVLLTAASEGAAYRWLTTSELEILLRGSWIVEADNRRSYEHTPEHFQHNGHYVRHSDNYEAHGTYHFRDGHLCTQAEKDPELCRRVLVDQAGQHWIVVSGNARLLNKIAIKPLR